MTKPSNDYYRLYPLWSRQLLYEFEEICWQYNVGLTAPCFEISEAETRYGCWLPDARTIRISSRLIINRPWSETLGVLKHEMAHQICSEILKSEETAHGPSFQKACVMLGVPEEYRGTKAAGHRGAKPARSGCRASGERRLIGKIEKLLALAGSQNENEAALAMAKANELLEKYNLQMFGHKESHYTFVTINHKRKRIEGYQRRICRILQDFFYVKVIFSRLYDPLSDQTHKTIELLGTEENIAVAEYCYNFLETRVRNLWTRNRHRFKGRTRTEKNSYYLGLLQGFYDKLKMSAQVKTDQCTGTAQHVTVSALMVTGDQGLNEFVGTRFPRLRTMSHRGPKIYRDTYDNGVTAGRQIILHKGVIHKEGNKGLMIAS